MCISDRLVYTGLKSINVVLIKFLQKKRISNEGKEEGKYGISKFSDMHIAESNVNKIQISTVKEQLVLPVVYSTSCVLEVLVMESDCDQAVYDTG